MAAEECGLTVTKNYLSLTDKPAWYAEKVNPQGKVPALAYGGSPTPGINDEPQPPPADTVILTESNLICEFLSDLTPNSSILPTSSPLTRYKIRAFIDAMGSSLMPAFMGFLRMGKPADNVYEGIAKLQTFISENGGSVSNGYAVGEGFTLADMTIAPFLARMEVTFKNDIGTYPIGEGKKLWDTLMNDGKYELFRAYWSRVKERESFVKTFDWDLVTKGFADKYKDRK
jgi:glutathione S-transferase